MLAIGTKPSGLRCSYRWCLDNCDRLDDLLLVWFRTRTIKVSDNGGHTSLVSHGRGEMDWLLRVIFGETRIKPPIRYHPELAEIPMIPEWGLGEFLGHSRLYFASMSGSTLSGEERERAMARSFELAVRHSEWCLFNCCSRRMSYCK